MRYSLETVTGPETPVATLSQLKAHLLVEHELDDLILAAYETAAARLAEAYTGRRFGEQTLRMELDEFPTDDDRRPKPIELVGVPVTAVAVVTAGGAAVTGYGTWLAHNPPLVLPPTDGWPELADGDRVVVEYTAGVTPPRRRSCSPPSC